MFDRAEEIAELKLEDEAHLIEWREKRRLGKVKVTVDNEDIDLANRVLGVELSQIWIERMLGIMDSIKKNKILINTISVSCCYIDYLVALPALIT